MVDQSKMIAQNLHVGWPGKTIAAIGEFELRPGEVVVLAGPNGVGKSTTIKTLARQLQPVSGSIEIGGQEIWSMDARKFAQELAYLPQMLDPPQSMLVKEMVAMGRNPHQAWWSWRTDEADSDAVRTSLEATGTAALSERPVGLLSGGELQRVCIAMALAQQTKFLLLDEPTAHLDYKYQLQLLELISKLRGNGLGIMLVLHDLNLIGRIADRVILLKRQPSREAIVAAAGTPATVLTTSTLRDVYEVEVAITANGEHGFSTYTPISTA
jgi:iron complex transport system ATP-binding protein